MSQRLAVITRGFETQLSLSVSVNGKWWGSDGAPDLHFLVLPNTGLFAEGEIASDNDGGAVAKSADQIEEELSARGADKHWLYATCYLFHADLKQGADKETASHQLALLAVQPADDEKWRRTKTTKGLRRWRTSIAIKIRFRTPSSFAHQMACLRW